jgi:hypothetical protein
MTSLANETGQTCSYFTVLRVCARPHVMEVQKLHEQLQKLSWRGVRTARTVHPTATDREPPIRRSGTMSTTARAIAWPVLTLLVIGGTHLVLEAIRPELHDAVGPAVVMPIYLAVGGWAAFGVARAGGGFVGGLIAATVLGLMPALLQLVGFGVLLGRDSGTVTTAALFGLAGMTWGGAIGAGIASSIAVPATAAVRAPATTVSRVSGDSSTG